ncbi:hypothetical protein ABZX63_40915, partial [Streptomyces tendae]
MPAPHSRPVPSRRQVLFTASAAAAATAIPTAPAWAAPIAPAVPARVIDRNPAEEQTHVLDAVGPV